MEGTTHYEGGGSRAVGWSRRTVLILSSAHEARFVDRARENPRSSASRKAPLFPSQGLRQTRARAQLQRVHEGRPRLPQVLGGLRPGAGLVQTLEEGPRLEAAQGSVVRGRQAQRLGQLSGPPPRGAAQEQGGADLGGRAGRPADADVPRPAPRGLQVRQRDEGSGHPAGRPRHALSADDPGASDRDAGLHAHRGNPLGRVRRFLRRVAQRPHHRPGREAPGDRRRRLAARPGGAPEADLRRGAHSNAVHRERRGRPAHRKGRFAEGRARPLVARADAGSAGPVRAGEDGRRGSALHPLHLGNHRKTQGHPAHDRRLSRGRLRDLEVGLRPQGRRRLLVHGRHRLGHGPLLRRLRATGERRDLPDVRRRARHAGARSLLGPDRAPRCHDSLHRAHRDPRIHEVGDRVARETRPLFAAPAGFRRRADQPGGVDLVSKKHRPRKVPGRRHVVADGNRHDPDHSASRA